MIKTEYVKDKEFCNNCKRHMSPCLKYDFISDIWGDDCEDNATMILCEDCSNAIGRLHRLAMEKGDNYKYYMDDFIKID